VAVIWYGVRLVVVAGMTLAVGACSSKPAQPTLAADYFAVQHSRTDLGAPAGTTVPGRDGLLVGPHSVVQFDVLARVTGLAADQVQRWGLPSAVHAAAGHELLLARTEWPVRDTGLGVVGEISRGVQGQVRVGDKVHPVPGWLGDGQTIVVSVPTGGEAVFTMADSGRTQTFGLGTGKRATDAVKPYYTTQTRSVSGTGAIRFPGLSIGNGSDNSEDIDVSAKITLQPYTEPDGWAPPGRARLVCTLSLSPHFQGAVRFD
jgi:hypothetical protein